MQTPNDLNAATVPGVEAENLPLDGAIGQMGADEGPQAKVAILLPLSGNNAQLGQALLSAAQIALFDIGGNSIELMPKDTLGTEQGARRAAQDAVKDGAQLIIGPLFSHSVKAVQPIANNARINVIAFSTDWTLANGSTFLIGFLPFDQVERITRYAASKGYSRIGILSPDDTYGNGVVSAYQAFARQAGINGTRIDRFSPQGNDLSIVVRKFADYDARKANNNAHGAPFDAVLMPVGGAMARTVGSFLSQYDLPPSQVRRLGTGLMDEKTLAKDLSLEGAWFAAPAPQARTNFERRYKETYGQSPIRLSSLAYDATALAAVLARTGIQRTGRPSFDATAITNPNGFAGVDGIFRFRPDGIVERGLAILTYKNGRIIVEDEAPRTFQHFGRM